ncbi:MAG: hypothetical protein JW682_01290 [Campylobacterales bacterium]|jgi:hypothetical protein|nr:hypothetical protein [Campylobacterales bacterium]HEO98177.1 hypothetical protein [Campylobacterota bacterium]
MIYKKIAKLTKKVFSSKTYLLMGLNRYVPETFGKLTDIAVDREGKNIYLQMRKSGEEAHLNILKYGVEYQGNTAYLTYGSIERDAYLHSALKDYTIDKRIKVDPKYIKIVQAML